ncbi:MAG: 2-C-methyl-D-erythritol 4-phosphate cytidylyltransferase [Nakamurella sp.]
MALIAVVGSPFPIDSGSSSGPAAAARADPAWADLGGRPLVWHAVRRLREAGVDRVALVVDAGQAEQARSVAADPDFGDTVTVTVAAARQSGMRGALAQSAGSSAPVVVLIHDPTRAFAPVAMIRRVIDAARAGAVAVVPVLPVVDTIRSVGVDGRASALVDRDALRIVQSPQAFIGAVLYAAYERADTPQDEAALLVAAGHPLTTVAGHADAARVLTAAELDTARRSLGPVPSGSPFPSRTPGQTRD